MNLNQLEIAYKSIRISQDDPRSTQALAPCEAHTYEAHLLSFLRRTHADGGVPTQCAPEKTYGALTPHAPHH